MIVSPVSITRGDEVAVRLARAISLSGDTDECTDLTAWRVDQTIGVSASTPHAGHRIPVVDVPVSTPQDKSARVAVVMPAFRVRTHILGVISAIGPEVKRIIVVDDACPDASGDYVRGSCSDPRVTVLRRAQNGGVGAAVKTGYLLAMKEGYDIIVKVDGDGQIIRH